MKAVKKYEDGGDLPLNKLHLKKIRERAEKALKRGDKEKASKLTARADKKEARQKKWKGKVDGFVAKQQVVAESYDVPGLCDWWWWYYRFGHFGFGFIDHADVCEEVV